MDDFPAPYTPIRLIDKGGFGAVWEAREGNSAETIAVKILNPDLTDAPRTRFRREVRLQSQLEHENVQPILDYDVDSLTLWYATPLAAGNLDDALPALSEAEALTLFEDCLLGMAFAHKNRVLHRDLKPGNVLVFDATPQRRRHARVADFGLGRAFTRDTPFVTATHVAAGTHGFSAPEQFGSFRDVDIRADVFSLGRILQYILQEIDIPGSPLGRRLEYCIRTAAAHEVADRYRSVDAFLADFRLAVQRPAALQRPIDSALEIIQQLIENGKFQANETQPLVQLFLEHRTDFRLLLGMLPRLPETLLAALLADHSAAMRPVLDAYCRFLDEPLAIDSVMTNLRLLEDILAGCTDSRIRELCLRTVLRLASRYNLAEASYAAIRCVVDERDPGTIQALAATIRADANLADWCRRQLSQLSLPPILRQAIEA